VLPLAKGEVGRGQPIAFPEAEAIIEGTRFFLLACFPFMKSQLVDMRAGLPAPAEEPGRGCHLPVSCVFATEEGLDDDSAHLHAASLIILR
jgi:hypothetical protein